MISLDDEVQQNKRYYQYLREKSVPNEEIIKQTNALVQIIQCMEGYDVKTSDEDVQYLSWCKLILCQIRVTVPYLNVLRGIFVNKAASCPIYKNKIINKFRLRCCKEQIFEILSNLDEDDARLLLKKVDCQETLRDNIVDAFVRKDREAFIQLLSVDECDASDLAYSCGVLRYVLSLVDYGSSLCKALLSSKMLDYLVDEVETMPDIDEQLDYSEETISAYTKLFSDVFQQSFWDVGRNKPDGGYNIAFLSECLSRILSDFEHLAANIGLDNIEKNILIGILRRPEAMPFLARIEKEQPQRDTTEIIEWNSFEDFMSKVKCKYAIDFLNLRASSAQESFFYKTFLRLNDGGLLTEQCQEKVNKIFQCLTQILAAIDVSESNYAKVVFLFTGKDALGNGGDKIEWKASEADFFCFVKNLVVEGKKYLVAKEHFLFRCEPIIAKDTSRIADGSLHSKDLKDISAQLGLHKVGKE